MKRWGAVWLPLLFLLLGAGLRFHALAQDTRFHPDEALFATFARRAAVNGDWLLHGALDKTPLSIYAQAASMMLVGVKPLPDGVLTLEAHAGEFAAHVPGTLASILLMAVMWRVGKELYPSSSRTRYIVSLQYSPVIALFLAAFSPYALAFSATAFTDGLMLLCVTLALWMGARRRALWAGLWLAVGFACKQQAVFYVPLVVGIAIIQSQREGLKSSPTKAAYWGFRFLLPIFVGIVLLTAWDGARGQESSMLALAAANNDPRNLISRWELLPRLATWADYLGNGAGTGWLTAGLGVLGLAVLAWRVARERKERETWIDVLLLAFCGAYMTFHLLIAFPTHDRYPLLMLPPLWLLMARGVEWAGKSVTQRHQDTRTQRIFPSYIFVPLCLCAFVLSVFPAAKDATEGRIGVGGDRGRHVGIDELGRYLESKPLGTIIYDHWLGWELGYYLDTWSDKRLTYYPQPILLANDARIQSDPAPRYFVAPIDESVRPWLDALREAGLTVRRDYRTERQIVYRLTREMTP